MNKETTPQERYEAWADNLDDYDTPSWILKRAFAAGWNAHRQHQADGCDEGEFE